MFYPFLPLELLHFKCLNGPAVSPHTLTRPTRFLLCPGTLLSTASVCFVLEEQCCRASFSDTLSLGYHRVTSLPVKSSVCVWSCSHQNYPPTVVSISTREIGFHVVHDCLDGFNLSTLHFRFRLAV